MPKYILQYRTKAGILAGIPYNILAEALKQRRHLISLGYDPYLMAYGTESGYYVECNI